MTAPVDESKTVTLRGNVHPLAKAQFDEGAVPDSFPTEHLLLILNRPAERTAALDQFLIQAHTQGSPVFHKWLKPVEYGERFGPADSDIETAVTWLAAHGFRVERVTKGRNLVEFSGMAGQVREAFHTEIHQYRVNGEIHHAAASEQMIPEALAPLVRGVSTLHDFRARPEIRVTGPAAYARSTGRATPLFTQANNAYYAVAPEDFATQYDLRPLYSAGVNGSGQTIGVIDVSNIDIGLANGYRQLFGLTNNPPQVVIDGGDPGIAPLPDSDLEAYLDVELSGAVAPGATVNLYISNGSSVQDPLSLAALRAIEDDQASVLSLSVGQCESVMNSLGNTVWFGFWQQAAAQGQTVLVATGDNGSAGCDEILSQPAQLGLAVNGFASTPWNVAVGGTDFLYPDYSSGPSAAAPYWNQTNDADYGSLKAPLPEQPWDGPLGLNISPSPGTIYATGGGASSCAQVTVSPSGQISCLAGYPKPSWQSGPGVPDDGVRDLPDVSLFAGGGENLSVYPICAAEGQCAAMPNSQPMVTLVGGTSAAAPAMAGIMALVVQKYGRQGQAGFTLYPLARQQPGAFHDVTSGSNNVPCVEGSPDCSLDTNGDGLYTLQEYPAGPGYDLASGLGSVDATALVMNWNSVTFQPTTTMLSLSGSSFVHGAPVAFTANVAPSSGTGTPTGNVALLTTSSVPLQTPSVFPLSGGTAGASVYSLPGGTYQLSAQYEGDGIFCPSKSAPQMIAISPEPSSILFTSIGPAGTVTNNGGASSYGQPWVFTAQPYGQSTQQGVGLASGTITFTNGSNSLEVPLNSRGLAAYFPVPLALGTNSITVSYSGDASFEPATAGPFVFTITKADPQIRIPPVETSVPIGGSLLVPVVMGTGYGTPPTGSVSVTLGSTTLTAPLTAGNAGGANALASVTFANIQTPGTLSLSVNYPGDGNWNAASFTNLFPITVAPSMLASSSTILSLSTTSINRSQSVTLSAMVYGSVFPPAPSGSVTFYVSGLGLVAPLVATGPSSAAAVLPGALTALNFSNGSNVITAVYSGDGNLNPSSSAPQTIMVDQSALSLSLGVPRVAISSGQSGNVPLVLNGMDGFNAQVMLSCLPSSSSIGCSVNPSQPMVSGLTISTLTVNAFVPGAAQNVPAPLPFPPVGPVAAIAALSLLIYVERRRTGRVPWPRAGVAALCGGIALLLSMPGCGGSSATSTGPPPPPPPIAAPPGTYRVLVTATAKGMVHDIQLTVVVQ